MGATSFVEYRSDENGLGLHAIYSAARSEARNEFGHDPYNGTISTTSGVRQMLHFPLTRKAAEYYAYQNVDQGEKWGDACAIPVASDDAFTRVTHQFTLVVPVTQDVLDWEGNVVGSRPTTEQDIHEDANSAARAKFGDLVDGVEVKPSLQSKVVVSQPEGRGVVRWEFNKKLYGTKAAAVKAAKQLMSLSPRWDAVDSAKVRAVKVWGESDAAVRLERVTVGASATVLVTVATPVVPVPAVTGWVFYGWAAC